MKFFRFFALLSLVLCLTSCEEDFVLVKKDFTPQLVINSVFKPDSKWFVHVSSSRDILNPKSQITNIENANVVIVEKLTKKKIYLDHVGDGIYSSNYYPPQPDKTYVLLVDVPGYKRVKAESMAPKKANIVNVIKDVVDEKVSTVNFQVKDDSKQYLIWNFISFKGSSGPADVIFTGNPKSFILSFMDYNHALSSFSGTGNDAVSSEGVFSSNITDESDDTEDGASGGSGSEEPDLEASFVIKRYLRVVTASSNLYNYYKSVERFLSAGNHNSSFSNSPEIYSNIENGLGIFAGYTEQLTEIE